MITIIVLLILAGISIQMLTGDNGILTRAGEAKEKTEDAQNLEIRRMATLEAATNLTETTFQGVTIPAGFAPTRIEGENTVAEGLVITDSNGNEFVWVVVPTTGEVYSTAGTSITEFTDDEYLKIAKDLAVYSESTLSNNPSSISDHLPSGTGVPDYTSAYKDVLKSIYQNGGFYVGRYETGIQGTENVTTSARSASGDTTQIAVIKENVQPYTFVTWGQAQTLAQGVSAGKKGDKTSSLLIGVQWDLVLKFIGKNGDTDSHEWGNYADSQFDIEQGKYAIYKDDYTLDTTWTSEDTENYVVNGTKLEYDGTWDNCKGMILTTTGANTTKNSKKNICDIAGNVYEWTIENTSSSNFPCSVRGGVFNNTGSYYPASDRSRDTTYNSDDSSRISCLTLLVDLSTDRDKLKHEDC